MSLIFILKRIGAITVPWGTSHFILQEALSFSLVLTHCFLLDKYVEKNCKLFSHMP